MAGIATNRPTTVAMSAPATPGAMAVRLAACNYMVTMIRNITQQLDNFTTEYATAIEHAYVDNRPVSEEIADALRKLRNEERTAELV